MQTLQHELEIQNRATDAILRDRGSSKRQGSDGRSASMSAADNKLVDQIRAFKKHSLNDLKRASLMDRVDTKFIVKKEHLPRILNLLQSTHSVLSVGGQEVSEYRNHYFDTPDMRLYKAHHNGKLNRYKVRQRHYVGSQLRFLEVKFKNNKKRTKKTRVRIDPENYNGVDDFVRTSMGGTMPRLLSKQISGYRRIAFANEEAAERITIDFDIWYQATDNGPTVELNELCIVEVKQAKKNMSSPFFKLAKQLGYAPTSFSKYCIGCALLYGDTLKSNRFKDTIAKHVYGNASC